MAEEKTEENESSEEEVEVEFTSRSEYITAAYYAIAAVESLNVMTMPDAKRKKDIITKSAKIIDSLISEMYDELFDEENNNS